MNRQEFINALAEKTALTKKDLDIVLDAFFETVGEALQQGDESSLCRVWKFCSR